MLGSGDLGALEGGFRERVADDAGLLEVRGEGFDEALVDCFLDEDPRSLDGEKTGQRRWLHVSRRTLQFLCRFAILSNGAGK